MDTIFDLVVGLIAIGLFIRALVQRRARNRSSPPPDQRATPSLPASRQGAVPPPDFAAQSPVEDGERWRYRMTILALVVLALIVAAWAYYVGLLPRLPAPPTPTPSRTPTSTALPTATQTSFPTATRRPTATPSVAATQHVQAFRSTIQQLYEQEYFDTPEGAYSNYSKSKLQTIAGYFSKLVGVWEAEQVKLIEANKANTAAA